jgi:hypothetical protein
MNNSTAASLTVRRKRIVHRQGNFRKLLFSYILKQASYLI